MNDYVFVMDVDGTICPIKKPDQSYSELSRNDDVCDRMKELKKDGATFILHSARQMRTYNGDLEEIERNTRPVLEDWIKRNDVPCDSLILGKPWAGPKGYYVDDRAMLPKEFAEWTPSTLIVPICGRSSRYPKGVPKYLYPVFPDNHPMIYEALQGIDLRLFSRKVFVILREHDESYNVRNIIRNIVPDAEFVILDKHTSCQTETVCKAIELADIRGQMSIRDCDSRIDVFRIPKGNSVAGYELRYGTTPEQHSNKCFLVTEKDTLMRIAEKDPVSATIGCGLYTFASAQEFMDNVILANDGETYISHIVSRMLSKGHPFRYVQSMTFRDWGTIDDYNRERGI